ncbi:hypothetical protein ACFLT5_00405 [Chloroflexota bacterium]
METKGEYGMDDVCPAIRRVWQRQGNNTVEIGITLMFALANHSVSVPWMPTTSPATICATIPGSRDRSTSVENQLAVELPIIQSLHWDLQEPPYDIQQSSLRSPHGVTHQELVV